VRSMSKSTAHAAVESNWKTILECAAVEVFEMMAGVRLEVDPAPAGEPQGEQTAMVGLAGALCGMIAVRCSNPVSVRLASLVLGGDATSNPSTARDSLGELCNMVAGNFKSKISSLSDRCMLSVPTVISGEDYYMEPAEPNDGITVALSFDGDPIWIILAIHS
jgi:chemotaxis protein CheX